MKIIIKELHFISYLKSDKTPYKNATYIHTSHVFSARKIKDELIIFSKKENNYLFILGHNSKLQNIGQIFNPNKTLSKNLMSAIVNGVVARDARYGLLSLNMINKKIHKEIFEISTILN